MQTETPQKEFYAPILRALIGMGGTGRAAKVLKQIEANLHFRKADRDLVAKDEERWHNRARFARKDLVELGLLQRGSPWGQWEISDAGKLWLKEHTHS